MIVRTLIPLGWILLGILAVVTLYGLVLVSTEKASSPEAGRGLGVFAVLFLMGLLALAGWLFSIAARRQSVVGLIIMTLVLLYPLVMLVAHPAIQAYKRRRFEKVEARVGDFPDTTPQAMAVRSMVAMPDAQALAEREGPTAIAKRRAQ